MSLDKLMKKVFAICDTLDVSSHEHFLIVYQYTVKCLRDMGIEVHEASIVTVTIFSKMYVERITK